MVLRSLRLHSCRVSLVYVAICCCARQVLAFHNNHNLFSTKDIPTLRPANKDLKLPPIISTFTSRQPHYYDHDISNNRPQRELSTKRFMKEWDGDDLRWIQRVRRRMYRSNVAAGGNTPIRATLIALNFLFFIYQTIDTVRLIIKKHPDWWPSDALFIISDTIFGYTRVRGGLTSNFVHSAWLSRLQPHRFLTSGFLHGDIIHLLLNLDALRRLPAWLETGLGVPLFLTTYLVSIVTGNIGHNVAVVDKLSRTFCLGASGGICGLYGLMYVTLVKMGRGQSALRVIKGMILLFIYGMLSDTVSNAGHFGGFLGGVAMGILCAPHYRKNYSMRRKWSLEVDLWPRDYRTMMGFGISPTKRGLIPVSFLWGAAAIAMALVPTYRAIPINIARGLLKPGSLSGM